MDNNAPRETKKIRKQLFFVLLPMAVGIMVLMALCVIGNLILGNSSAKRIEADMRNDYDIMIKNEVETAVSMLDRIYHGYEVGDYSLEEAEKLGANLLRNLEYGKEGYFWADTKDGVNVVLQGSEVEGTNRIDAQDSDGYYYIRDIIAAGMAGGGYCDYKFTKNVGGTEFVKRSYSLYEPNFGWIVGTGVYTDTIDQVVNEHLRKARNTGRIIMAVILTVGLFIGTIEVLRSLRFGKLLADDVLDPIGKLVDASQKIASGDLDVEIECSSMNEIGILERNFSKMAASVKSFILYFSDLAYQDELTGLKNKAAYDKKMIELSSAIANREPKDPPIDIALVFMDANNLKRVNDEKGHSAGDAFIKEVTSIIKQTFGVDNCYRYGGDEFVALLETANHDFVDGRIEVLRELCQESSARNKDVFGYDVVVAAGVAYYDPHIDYHIKEVMKRADKEMYINKKKLKEGQ